MSSKSLALAFQRKKGDNRPKYKNTVFEKDGMIFSSKLEYQRYLFLREAEECGEIEDLKTQVPFELIPKQTKTVIKHLKTKDKPVEVCVFRACTYVADFTYRRNGQLIVEDTKGNRMMIDQKFPIKQKLMYYRYQLYVNPIYKATSPLP